MEESQSWELACNFVNCGMRLPLIHSLTGICPSRLRHLHKKVNGTSAAPGRTAEIAHVLIKNRAQAMQAAKFINYYNFIGGYQDNGSIGWRSVDPKVMLAAYLFYLRTTNTPIDINLAFYIIRDLSSNRMESRRCPKCGIMYVFAHENEALQTCPMC